MSYVDLQRTLSNWSYDPDRISVRKILGENDSVKIQLRVELGVLQMEEDGRPDGEKPRGCESLLEHHQAELARQIEQNGTTLGFALSPQECEDLRGEMSLYYRRYVAMFVLDEFEKVVRDTAHSIGVMDLCKEHALEREDRLCIETFRPYVLMMNARARAACAIQNEDPTSALAHVNRGIMHIRTHFDSSDQPDLTEDCDELKLLEDLSGELANIIPKDSLVHTRNELRAAIDDERFEDAAKLRDTLEKLYEQPARR